MEEQTPENQDVNFESRLDLKPLQEHVEAIKKEKFREDLYYRLSTVEIHIPPLRDRKDDIHLLFRKFASDFAAKYKMPTIRLDENALQILLKFRWSGNIRQLRNIAEQISVLERERTITADTLSHYLPNTGKSNLPAVINRTKSNSDFSNEREILYKVLFDMKSDLNDLKKLTMELMQSGNAKDVKESHQGLIQKIYGEDSESDEEEIITNINLKELEERIKNIVIESRPIPPVPPPIPTTPPPPSYIKSPNMFYT